MTSAKQAAANRQNAEPSTGPRSVAGKTIARLNSLKHGGLSLVLVIPHVERLVDWESHRRATLASLQPVGHLETVLAERVALVLWRLDRVTRYERDVATVQQERVEGDLADSRRFSSQRHADSPIHPSDVQEAVRQARGLVTALERAQWLPDDALISGEETSQILCAVADRRRRSTPRRSQCRRSCRMRSCGTSSSTGQRVACARASPPWPPQKARTWTSCWTAR